MTLRVPPPPRATVTSLTDPAVARTHQDRVCMGRAFHVTGYFVR
ncbi:MAG: hypothetical protein ABSE70_10155 [Candidatus Limnocylindrales bacterium]